MSLSKFLFKLWPLKKGHNHTSKKDEVGNYVDSFTNNAFSLSMDSSLAMSTNAHTYVIT